MANYTGVNHLAMVTHDMPTTIRFWRDLLGMRLIAGLGRRGYRHYFFEISDNDMIAFFEWPQARPIAEKDHGVPVKGPVAFDHVSIGVESDNDLWQLKDRLEAAGFWVSEVIDHGFIHSIYSFDPNNIAIEFSAPVAELDLRKVPCMLDKHPLAEGLEGAEARLELWPDPENPTTPEKRAIYPGEGMVFRAHRGQKQ
jgi:catechol 2,3-dioxygenase-like lactoylglutathione lyase family enzyme